LRRPLIYKVMSLLNVLPLLLQTDMEDGLTMLKAVLLPGHVRQKQDVILLRAYQVLAVCLILDL